MKVLRGLENVPDLNQAVVTIGSFDGMHLGHQKIFKRLRSLANQIDGVSVVISFEPHPRQIIYPKDKTLRLINSLDEKIEVVSHLDIDYLIILPFTVEFSQIRPQEYVEKFLIESINPAYIVIGYDHQFGLNRAGDFNLLKQYESEGHFKLIKIEKQEIEEMTISSTSIRNAIQEGDIGSANGLLGYDFYLSGIVVEGQKLGRQIDYPTANLEIDFELKILPADGIYAVKIKLENNWHYGMLYVGNKPTLEGEINRKKNIEVHIFDFDQDIYDKRISVHLKKFIHPDKKYDSLDDLKQSIVADEQSIRGYFNMDEKSRPAKNADTCIAILNYNGYEYLESFLPYMIESSSDDLDIIVIDNKSTDDSIQLLEEWFPEVKLIKLEKNFGFAQGYNLGILELKYEYIVLLNSDVKTTTAWLDPILNLMKSDETIAAAQPKILSLENENSFEYAGAAGGFIDNLGYPFCRGRIFDHVEEDDGQYDDPIEVFWTSGAAMVVRKNVWDQLKGFDGSFFAHMEEIDFCWRAKRAGYKLMYLPDSAVYHIGGGTMTYDNPRKTHLNFKNNLTTILKNESFGRLLWLFPLRLILDGVAGLKFLIGGKGKLTMEILKAHMSVYFNLFSIIAKRKQDKALIESIKKDNPNILTGRYKRSILVSHFLKGITKYSELKF